MAHGMYNTLPLNLSCTSSHVIPPPFTLLESFHIENRLTLFQTTPHSTSHHHSSPYRTFHITFHITQAIPLCNTIISSRPISATLCITPHLALRPISHYVPHNATFHVLHTIYWPHYASHHHHILHLTTLNRISHAAPHLA